MIVIPMAGLSTRFKKAGYLKPKFELTLSDDSLFSHSLRSFSHYFSSDLFLFIALKQHNSTKFIKHEADLLGIDQYQIVELNEPTNGQATTVYKGLQNSSFEENSSLLIFNIDTFRPNFTKPVFNRVCNGYLEVFKGTGDNWSYCLTDEEDNEVVIKTAEKNPISDFCCSGIYYFENSQDFLNAYEYASNNDLKVKNEFYIAPLYNILIENGKQILIKLIDRSDVIFCGTPNEYKILLNE